MSLETLTPTIADALANLKALPKSFQDYIKQENEEADQLKTSPRETEKLAEPERKKRRLCRNKKSSALHRERKKKYIELIEEKIKKTIILLEQVDRIQFPILGRIDANKTTLGLEHEYLINQ